MIYTKTETMNEPYRKENCMENSKKNSKYNIVFITLIAIQFLYMLYWGTQKSGYYVDEFFTYDNAHYISESTPNRVKMYDADYMTYDEWHLIADLRDTLTVNRDNSLLNDSLMHNIRVITKKPYMVLLNYVETIFFEGDLSKWSGISLNILFFALNQLLLYKLAKRMSQDDFMALLSVAMYGFSGMAVSMVVYVRFYTLVTLLMTCFTYIHIVMWQTKSIKKNIILELLSLPLLYLSYKSSPIAVIQGAGVIMFYLLALLFQKRWRQAVFYGVPGIGGGLVYATLFTNYIKYFLNPEKYAALGTTSSAASSLLTSLTTMNAENLPNRIFLLIQMIERYLFGTPIVLVLFIITFVAGAALCLQKKVRIFEKEITCFWIVLGSCVFYMVVSICFNLGHIRYNSSVFPELAVCFVFMCMFLSKSAGKERLAASVVSVCLFISLVFTCTIPTVENLYQEDGPEVQKIQAYDGINSVVLDYNFDDRVMYECVAFADRNTEVMFVKHQNMDCNSWGDNVLVWQSVSEDHDALEEILVQEFNSVEEIANTHESVVYLVKR